MTKNAQQITVFDGGLRPSAIVKVAHVSKRGQPITQVSAPECAVVEYDGHIPHQEAANRYYFEG